MKKKDDNTNTNKSKYKSKSIFVTVGTTSFDALIRIVDSTKFLTLIQSLGYNKITIQYGKGEYIPSFPLPTTTTMERSPKEEEEGITAGGRSAASAPRGGTGGRECCVLQCESYRYKSSLLNDIQSSDLIISHAGAGSITECLFANKILIVVINNKLMNNHQCELAFALSQRGYLLCVSCPEKLLEEDNEDEDGGGGVLRLVSGGKSGGGGGGGGGMFIPKVFPKGDNGRSFADLLDDQMGFS